MKKIVLLMMALLIAGAALFAGARGESDSSAAGGKTKVVFWHSFGGSAGDVMNKLIADYNASQDKVIVEGQNQGSYDDAIAKIRSTPKGQGPDIMQLYDIGTRWAVDSGLMLKMQDFINADKYDVSDYEPNILAYYTLNGELYSMPFNCSSPVLVYNKEALAKAGLDPATAFATLESCLDTSKKLKAAGLSIGGSLGANSGSWAFEQLVGIQGAELVDNGNGRRGRATRVIADQALLDIFTRLNAIALDPSNRAYGRDAQETRNQFDAGTVGYMIDSCASYVNHAAAAGNKFHVGFVPVPKVKNGDTGGVSVGGGSLWLVDSGDFKRENAAWDFIKYVTGARQQAAWAIATSYLPIRRSAANLPEYQDYMKNRNPEIMVAINALRNSKPSSAGAVMGVFPRARVIIESEVEAMMNNPSQVTPRMVVDKIVSQINDEITLYNRTN